jgi:hypothetical protein
MRLFLASLVLYAHGYYLAAVQWSDGHFGPHFDQENVGTWVVFGFFALSGCLIAHGSLSGYLTTPTTPGGFLVTDAALRINSYVVEPSGQSPAEPSVAPSGQSPAEPSRELTADSLAEPSQDAASDASGGELQPAVVA